MLFGQSPTHDTVAEPIGVGVAVDRSFIATSGGRGFESLEAAEPKAAQHGADRARMVVVAPPVYPTINTNFISAFGGVRWRRNRHFFI